MKKENTSFFCEFDDKVLFTFHVETMHVSRQVLSPTKAKHLTNYFLTADGLTTFPGALRDEQVQHLF